MVREAAKEHLTPTMERSLAAEIRAARQVKNWSKGELARRAGVPPDRITDAEKAAALPDAELRLICNALSIQYTVVSAPADSRYGACPYRGLAAFQEGDASLFFGRERFTDRIVKKLEQGSIVGVIGASGSGKSSIVRAGVIPKLRKEGGAVRLCSFRPQRRPMVGLTGAIADLVLDERNRIGELPQLQTSLSTEPALIVQELQRRCEGELIVIFVDQFEELFSQTDSTQERAAFFRFIEEVASAGAVQPSRIKLIFSVRGDFYQQTMASSEFAELVQDQLVTLTQMNSLELRDAIVMPAELAQRHVEEELIKTIIDDAGVEPGNMPLVSFCLSELWSSCEGETLTLEAYQRMDGLNGAIASQAEKVYQRLDEPQQKAARRLMSRLVRIEEDTRAGVGETRRKLRNDSLASNEQERRVAERLVESRLAITDYDEQEGADTIELAHEAVIKHWRRLGEWLLEDRAFLVWQQRVEADALIWERDGKPKGAVLRGNLLAEGHHWVAEGKETDMKALVLDYIEQSWAVFEEEARTRFEGFLRTLLGAEPENVTRLIAEIRAAFSHMPQEVADNFLEDSRSDRGAWKLRLLRVRDDPTQGEHILEHLKGCDPSELPPIILALKDISDIVADPLRALLLDNEAGLATRLRAACAFAHIEPADATWKQTAPHLAEGLAAENPLHLLVFAQCLMPVADELFGSIQNIMSDSDRANAIRDNAALFLHELAGPDPDRIVSILTNCTDQVLEFVFEAARGKADVDEVALRLKDVVGASNGVAAQAEILGRGRQRASAAIVLAKMGSLRDALSVLDGRQKPDSASQFVFRARRLGVDCGALAQELVRAETPERIYWLSLAVGEYEPEQFTAVIRNALLKETQGRYLEHPSAIVHSVSGWLLGAFKQNAFLASANKELCTAPSPEAREWFHVEGPCGPMAFVMIPGGDFTMGAPEDEAGYKAYEGPVHSRSIVGGFAACVREVTVDEYAAFVAATGSPPLQNIAEFSPDGAHPAIALTWHEARQFCDWLTGWAHEKTSVKCAFSLPSEAEWEYCARAGTVTAFSYGSDRQLLENFAWFETNSNFKAHPAGLLRPNQFGIFNMHGNCWEWCEDIYSLYEDTKAQPFDALAAGTEDPLRTLRGGCWNLHWRYSRAACRNWHAPTNRNYYTGMRLYCRF